MKKPAAESPEDKRRRHEKEHDRAFKLIGAYTAFVAALFIGVVTISDAYPLARLVASLLAVSLPSLAAFLTLDLTIRVKQGREKSAARGLATALGFFPSFAGIIILIWHLSKTATVAFFLLTVYWVLRHDRIIFLNPGEDSDM